MWLGILISCDILVKVKHSKNNFSFHTYLINTSVVFPEILKIKKKSAHFLFV